MSLLTAVLQEADKASSEELRNRCDKLVPKLKDLTERIQVLSFALQQYFTDLYVNITPTKSLEYLNYKNRKESIIADYSSRLLEVENLRRNYGVKDEEFTKCHEKLNMTFQLFKDMCTLAEGRKILEAASHEFCRFNYTEAMLSVIELQRKLKYLKFEENLQSGLENLKYELENQLSLQMAQVSLEWEDIFKWSENKSINYLTYSLSVLQSDPVLIQKVLKSLYAAEKLNAELGMFSHFFIDKILHNVIRHNCEIFTEDHIGALVFNIKIDLNEDKKPSYQSIFNNLTAVFEFLESTLGSHFECNKKFITVFADSIREKFFNKIIEDCIKDNLPSCEGSYEDYKGIVTELESFNKFLIDFKFVDAEKSPLTKYIVDTEVVLHSKKCSKLLADCRSILSESLQHGTVEVGTSENVDNESMLNVTDKEIMWDLAKPLFLPKCVISQNVKQVMTMIVDHLEESVKMPEKYRKLLIFYVRDVAVLYQSHVPLKFNIGLEICPRDIALFFNNCFYMAHGFLGPPWKSVLPPAMAEQLTTVMIESIQGLRMVGLEKISLYLQTQKANIQKSVENRNSPIILPWTQGTLDQFDSALNDVTNLLKELKEAWYNILPETMYEKSICSLIMTLCQSILVRLFADSRPISEELANMLVIRLSEVIDDIKNLIGVLYSVDKKVDLWCRVVKMPVLLMAQLLEVAELWKEDKDIKQNFTCEEIRQIIKMRFPDNKYRLRILKEIQ